MSELSTLSLSELDQLQKSIQAEVFKRRQREEAGLLAEIRQKAALLGLSSEDLVARLGKAPGLKKAVSAPRFRDPQTHAEWSGRGRKPLWLVAYLNKGVALDELRIR